MLHPFGTENTQYIPESVMLNVDSDNTILDEKQVPIDHCIIISRRQRQISDVCPHVMLDHQLNFVCASFLFLMVFIIHEYMLGKNTEVTTSP